MLKRFQDIWNEYSKGIEETTKKTKKRGMINIEKKLNNKKFVIDKEMKI